MGNGVYLAEIGVKNFRCIGSTGITVPFNEGVTALVGENDSGKSAIVDAIRYALLTRDSESIRVQADDFHISDQQEVASQIVIHCKIVDLSKEEQGAFLEYLTTEDSEPVLHVHWRANRIGDQLASRRWCEISVRSGPNGDGPAIESSARQLLAAAYLRPLRDAEREMSAGRGSRLSQILMNVESIKSGGNFDPSDLAEKAELDALGLVGITDLFRHLVDHHAGVAGVQKQINDNYLNSLVLAAEELMGVIGLSEGGNVDARLRQVLERLEINLLDGATEQSRGSFGLGSNNLLFIACELLLLATESEGLPLLLVEEPEAHLHPQRQLRLMEFLIAAASPSTDGEDPRRQVQVIVTTHSPNLSSKIPLENQVLIRERSAYPLSKQLTRLDESDYQFLQRYLDVTKANLLFARGVLIVEGPAEAILLPTIAELIGLDLTTHGVSIVDVGGTGLGRYARILQRKEGETTADVGLPVSVVTDLDVWPDCAPELLGKGAEGEWPERNKRKWVTRSDLESESQTARDVLEERRNAMQGNDSTNVRTFSSDHWTLEYDLAAAGLALEMHTAICLARNDVGIARGSKSIDDITSEAASSFAELGYDNDVELACARLYRNLVTNSTSKPVAAQYLASLLKKQYGSEGSPEDLRDKLPKYLLLAIEHVTRISDKPPVAI